MIRHTKRSIRAAADAVLLYGCLAAILLTPAVAWLLPAVIERLVEAFDR